MPRQKRKGGAMGRYVLRHILRAPGKSLLCLLLAVVFMLGLMLIRVSAIRSENELEHLYTTTTVTVELLSSRSASNIGFIYPSTVEKLTETGFLSHRYLEASTDAAYLIRLNADGEEMSAPFASGQDALYGIEDPGDFLGQYGYAGEIAWFDGWDESVFRQTRSDWQGENGLMYPALVSQTLYELLEMEPGDLLRAGVTVTDPKDPFQNTRVLTDLTVVGTHPGPTGAVLMPMESYRWAAGTDQNYKRVILTVDPAMNRQLDEFRDRLPNLLSGGGTVSITAVWWDQELRQAIAPMEQVISLMKTLYPVTLALSLVVAAGISVLLSLLSAKEAAILRVLGNSRARCRTILCLQNILVCAAGVVVGCLGAAVMAYAMLSSEDAAGLMLPALGRAGLYLIAAALGAVGASVVMTAKNPLELLQVRE